MANTEKGIYYPDDYTKTADVLADMKTMAESVDAAIEKSKYNDKEIKDEIKNIQDEQEMQDENIKKNTTKNTEQDELIQKLKKALINETTEQDTSIHIEDASDVPAVLSIEGNRYQEQQKGTDNLAVLNEGSITQDGITVDIQDGVASFSGVSTSDATTYITVGTAYLYEGQTYYLNKDRVQSSGSSGFSIKNGTTITWWDGTDEKAWECTKTGEYEVRISFAPSPIAAIGTFKLTISKTSGVEWVQGKKAIPSVEYPGPIKIVGDNINILPNEATSQTEGDLEWTVNSDGSVHVVGTASSNALFLKKGTNNTEEVFRFKANKIYKNVGNVDIIYKKIDGGYARKLKEEIFSYEEDEVINQLYLQVPSGQTVDETYYPKIVEYYEGIDESYSPYAMGSVKITKVNKNRFNVPTQSLSGVDLILQDDGKYKINGNSTASWRFRNGEEILLEAGDYTLSVEVESGTFNGVFGIIGSNNFKYETRSEINISLTEDKKVKCYFTCSATATFDNVIAKVQLEKSDTKTDWIKHEQKEYILPVQQEMLEGDYFDLKNDKEVHGFKIKIFDGTETITTTSNGNSFSYNALDILRETNILKVPQLFSNCYIASSWNDRNTNNKANTIAIYNYTIGFDKGEFSTIEEFKAELIKRYNEGNPIYVIYPLAEAEKLDLTKEQKEVLQQLNALDLYKGTNNIYTEQDLALLQLDYTADTKMYIDNKIANTNAQILNVAGGN